jgi:hypothetical protein
MLEVNGMTVRRLMQSFLDRNPLGTRTSLLAIVMLMATFFAAGCVHVDDTGPRSRTGAASGTIANASRDSGAWSPTSSAAASMGRHPSEIKPNFPVATPQIAAPITNTPAAGSLPSQPGWIPAVPPRAWRWIVIHHSATNFGSAQKFDRDHRAQGWDELGYHFVIDNGKGGPDGRVEIGPRWTKQKHGAHAKTADDRYNNFGIGICLVGNFDNGPPTPKQMQALAELIAFLQFQYGIPPGNVIGHRDTKATACPGRYLSIAAVREQASQRIASATQATVAPMRQTNNTNAQSSSIRTASGS